MVPAKPGRVAGGHANLVESRAAACPTPSRVCHHPSYPRRRTPMGPRGGPGAPEYAAAVKPRVRVYLGHGASGSAATMEPFAAGLRARGVDAVAIDLPKRRAEDAVPRLLA